MQHATTSDTQRTDKAFKKFFFDVETTDFYDVDKLTFGDDPISLAVGVWSVVVGDNEQQQQQPSPLQAQPLIFTDNAHCRAWINTERQRVPEFANNDGGSIAALMACLDEASIIVAYNHAFDVGTLRAYVDTAEHYAERRAVWERKTIDPFDTIRKRIDIWPKLNDVARANFTDCHKIGKSSEAPEMLQRGDIEHLWMYCWMDVVITKRVYDIRECKTIVPEKINKQVFALTEVDVAKKIRKAECRLMTEGMVAQGYSIDNVAAATDTRRTEYTKSKSQLKTMKRAAVEEIIARLSLDE